MSDRYDTTGHRQTQFEPGSEGRVLANRLGITDPAEMANVELDLLSQLYDAVIESVRVDQRISVADLLEWHRRWLGNLYNWAGQYRTLNMGKAGFPFAASDQIPRLMTKLDSQILGRQTPAAGMTEDRLADAIAVVHVELILIHPFREGNGHISRLLASVMALQAGWPELDFKSWDANKDAYFAAIQAGLENYEPMRMLVKQVLRETAQQASGRASLQ